MNSTRTATADYTHESRWSPILSVAIVLLLVAQIAIIAEIDLRLRVINRRMPTSAPDSPRAVSVPPANQNATASPWRFAAGRFQERPGGGVGPLPAGYAPQGPPKVRSS